MARKSRFTPAQWRKIQMRYEGGDKIKDIARDWHVSQAAISQKAKKEGWVHGDKLVKEAITKKARDKVIEGTADEQANKIRQYIKKNSKRADDMYRLFELQLYSLTEISMEHVLRVKDAKQAAKDQFESMLKAELARVAIEGGDPRPVARIPVDMPDMGRNALDARRLAECFATLDATERRILGLDGGNTGDDPGADPLEGWMSDLNNMRNRYLDGKDRRKKMLDDVVDNLKNGGQGSDTEEDDDECECD